MVFGIVQQICSVVPGHDVALFNAVPQQHTAFEHFAQTGTAVHPALCKPSMPLCAIVWLQRQLANVLGLDSA
jgi:hypothetical protein